MTQIDCLKPDHGKPFKLNIGNLKTADAIAKIVIMQHEATLYLFHIIDANGQVPCAQCWKDVALMFRDIGELMMELEENKK